jgi:hypothetical protein
MNLQELNTMQGLQFMPVQSNKMPIEKGWQKTAKKYNLGSCEAVGLVCGVLSGNVEVVDIDCKYDLTGRLFDDYKAQINNEDKTLLKKLVVQKTRGGGFHFIYRCKTIQGNLKLAQRHTTPEEKNETYLAEIKKGATKEVAEKRASNDKVRVLLETRGEGGYVVCFPSTGYELIYGDYYSITEITEAERETLHNIARQFNEIIEEFKPHRQEVKQQIKGVSPFEDYNNRGDVIGLLEKHGWQNLKNHGSKTVFLRPGQTSSQSSGNFDHNKNWFSVFTTSSEFEPMKAYQPYAVYAVLECGKDFTEASKRLYDEGYGDRKEMQREINASVPSRINIIDDDYSFVAKPEDYETYLHQVRTGTLPMGLSTGMPEMDKYFLFKQGNLVIINGFDNVGKTKVMLFLAMMSSLLHGWKWIIYSSENTLGNIIRTLIEFYVGRKLDKINEKLYQEAKDFAEKHFTIIKSDEALFNYRDIINMTKKLLKRQQYQSVLVDPYNSLKIELNNTSKLNTHEYHYEAVSEIKMFGRKENIGFYINMHVVTVALRMKDAEGYEAAPQKADTEGGGKFSAKADEFLTVHRRTQHPQDWMINDIYVRKVKEWETGGKPTPLNSPVRLRMNETGVGFSELNETGSLFDPINAWKNKTGKQIVASFEPKLWQPFSDDKDIFDETDS